MKIYLFLITFLINGIMLGQEKNKEEAILGAGCFWCIEAVFEQIEGVESVEAGYSGGHVKNPTYEQICTKTTGHAEVAKIVYNPTIISFEGLLDVFWKTHDPTTLNRQGNDKGPQYRSAIFYLNENQRQTAIASKDKIEKSGLYENPIVTEISPLINYFKAENYHQNYFQRIGDQNPYCTYVIKPKVKKFQKEFETILKPDFK